MKQAVSIWRLADDPDAYGDIAGWFILVTPDGEEEVAGTWATEEGAREFAEERGWEVVPLLADEGPDESHGHKVYGSRHASEE